MNVKVTGDDKFMGCSCSGGEKGTEVIEEEREWFRMSRRRWRTIDIDASSSDAMRPPAAVTVASCCSACC